ncbi:hypothetical protein [Providencia sneebia]|uniref:DUF2975 domain-containing protein n=1 Tax=Providencia sneebia DSM 19967 TaxID=1141660 RepID=K8WDD6_9GAMM|nr:hypothetical protein [Providencia sneebia]EKT58584.1 hypothetical protein OO7_07709 [Providencia sneebia DSM 19967]
MSKSNKKLFFYSKSIAFIIWIMAVTDLVCDYYFWITRKEDMLYAIIESIDPTLLEKNIELASSSVILLMLLSHIPVLISSLSLFFVGYFFFETSKGEIWTQRNIKILFIGGILAVITPIISSLLGSLASLALSISLPPGDRIFVFYLGFSSEAMREIIYGIMILSLALIMKETKKISEENQQYI